MYVAPLQKNQHVELAVGMSHAHISIVRFELTLPNKLDKCLEFDTALVVFKL